MANLRPKQRAPLFTIVCAALLVASLIFGGYYYRQYNNIKDEVGKSADERNKEVITKAGAVYELPKDEQPVVAIVSDEETFKKEYPVFTTAKKDDVLLLYEKAGQAILYRESENKIVGTASFAVNKGAAVHIVGSVEAQNSTETLLLEKLPNQLRVSGKSTSTVQYTTTSVIDISGSNTDLAKKIATELGGTVATTVPSGEKISEGAQIAIILATPTQSSTTPPATQ